MRVGLDRLPSCAELRKRLEKSRIGVLAHPASVDAGLRHVSAVLADLGLRPAVLFGPEHGYGGEAQDMIGVSDARDPRSGAPIVSLYGDRFEDLTPTRARLGAIDALVIDLADVGSRYYTFVWTALLATRAAAAAGVHTVILDRPNPIGGDPAQIEGALQREGFLSFVGLRPVPVRHGLTIGEIVARFAAAEGLALGENGALSVVAVEEWDRRDLAAAWDRPFVMPSPNMPTAETALVYPGGCLLEGTNLSDGRGTTRPFEITGAPWIQGESLAERLRASGLEGFVARPLTFRPTFHKHAGTVCGGVQIHVTDPGRFRPYATYLALIGFARAQDTERFRFRTERYEYVDDIPAIDLLTGSARFRGDLESGAAPADVARALSAVDAAWAEERAAAMASAERARIAE